MGTVMLLHHIDDGFTIERRVKGMIAGCANVFIFIANLPFLFCSLMSIVYPPPLFHMESMWNVNIPWNFHGIHVEYVGSIRIPTWNPHGIHMEYIYSMDSIWNIFHHINKVFIHMDF